MVDNTLAGKTLLIAGAARGIGRACAFEAARLGARLILTDVGVSLDGSSRSSGPIDEVAQELASKGVDVMADSADITDPAEVERLVQLGLERFGTIDALLNPAGILRDAMMHKMSHQDWRTVLDVHLNGSFNLARAVLPLFRERQQGALIFFTSTSGILGNTGQANYGAAKAGLVALSRIIAMENQSKGIRSNAIAPFAFTRMIESIPVTEQNREQVAQMQQIMSPERVARFALSLCCDAANWVTGQIFAVRGNEISLFCQPSPVRVFGRPDEWSTKDLVEKCLPAMKGAMAALDDQSVVFDWSPV